jgi:hypothetical protein
MLYSILQSACRITEGLEFTVFDTDYYGWLILNGAGDAVRKEKEPCAYDIKFEDFDSNGYSNTRIYYITTVPGMENLLLYRK